MSTLGPTSTGTFLDTLRMTDTGEPAGGIPPASLITVVGDNDADDCVPLSQQVYQAYHRQGLAGVVIDVSRGLLNPNHRRLWDDSIVYCSQLALVGPLIYLLARGEYGLRLAVLHSLDLWTDGRDRSALLALLETLLETGVSALMHTRMVGGHLNNGRWIIYGEEHLLDLSSCVVVAPQLGMKDTQCTWLCGKELMP